MTYGRMVVRRLGLFGGGLLLSMILLGCLISLLANQYAYKHNTPVATPEPFPIGVDPRRATITEQILVSTFYDEHIAQTTHADYNWLNRLAANLQTQHVWQQAASPVTRVFIVWPGERTAEAAANIGGVLRWNRAERQTFISLIEDNSLEFNEGYLLPGRYTSHRYATPKEVAELVLTAHQNQITDRYPAELESMVPLADALIIASLIEREASDFANMREVSGVIWNRLFIDMPLQLDATLQYVKAEQPSEPAWWPAVRPADKYLDSPHNTYQHVGLPPSPIANPSAAAVVAALNPRATTCLYYFHAPNRDYYCSETYEDHVTKLRSVYGQGS